MSGKVGCSFPPALQASHTTMLAWSSKSDCPPATVCFIHFRRRVPYVASRTGGSGSSSALPGVSPCWGKPVVVGEVTARWLRQKRLGFWWPRCACGLLEIDIPRCGNEKQPPTRSRIEGCLIDVWRVLHVALPTTCPKCQAGKSHAQQTHRSRFWHGLSQIVIGQRKGEFIVQRIPRARRTEILE